MHLPLSSEPRADLTMICLCKYVLHKQVSRNDPPKDGGDVTDKGGDNSVILNLHFRESRSNISQHVGAQQTLVIVLSAFLPCAVSLNC